MYGFVVACVALILIAMRVRRVRGRWRYYCGMCAHSPSGRCYCETQYRKEDGS